jgi:uncharacterized phage protein (TIGR02218 family)
MRLLPPGLQDHLSGGATTLAWCWKLEPRNGEVLGFTDHDRDLVIDGVTYKAQAGFTGSAIEASLGLAVDNLEVTSALRAESLSEAKLRAGIYDNAAIEIWLVNWADVQMMREAAHLRAKAQLAMAHLAEAARTRNSTR